MLARLYQNIHHFSKRHNSALILMNGSGLMGYAGSYTAALIPVVIASWLGEMRAGIFVAALNTLQFAFLDPLAGNISDRIGSRNVMRISAGLYFLAGLTWLIWGDNLFGIIGMSLLYFIASSFHITVTYLLRTTKPEEGGLILGIVDSIAATSRLGASLSIPFFIATGSYHIAATIVMAMAFIFLIHLAFIKDGLTKHKPIHWIQTLNPLDTIKYGLNFIRVNKKVPILLLACNLFVGLFYGTLWFIVPISIAEKGLVGFLPGLQLGIHDLVTIALAGITGWLADHYDWQYMHTIGWIILAIGSLLLPLFPSVSGLILLGFIISFGLSFAFSAAEHALERYDIDHQEDGHFMAFAAMVMNVGFAIAPLIAGVLYATVGFERSLIICAITGVGLSIIMILFLTHLNTKKLKTK